MVDKQGHAVLVGQFQNNDMTDGRTPRDVVRTFIYMIDCILEKEDVQKNGIVVFHDFTDLSPKNLDIRIPKIIHGIYIYNAPEFYHAMFGVVSLMMPAKMRARVHFMDSLDDVYEVIDKDEMLIEHGGKREHDAKAWVAAQMEREVNGNMESLGDCNVPSL